MRLHESADSTEFNGNQELYAAIQPSGAEPAKNGDSGIGSAPDVSGGVREQSSEVTYPGEVSCVYDRLSKIAEENYGDSDRFVAICNRDDPAWELAEASK